MTDFVQNGKHPQLWIVECPDIGVMIRSDKGYYGQDNPSLNESMHIYENQIVIENNPRRPQQVTFIVRIGK